MARTSRRPSEASLIRAAWALAALLFACAFSLNGYSHYTTVLAVLTLLAAATAAANTQASLILVVATPALDAFGVLVEYPWVTSVFQVVLVASLAGVTYRAIRHRERMRPWVTLWDVGILVFLSAVVLSVPLSQDLSRSLLGTIQIAAEVGMYVLLSRAAPLGESRRRIGSAVVLVGVISALIATTQEFAPHFAPPLLDPLPHASGSSFLPLRATALFLNPNSLALLLVLAAVIATERTLRSEITRERWFWGAAGFSCAIGVGATFSRQGLIGLFIGVLATVLMASPSLRAIIVSAALILGLTIAVFVIPGLDVRARSIFGFQSDPSAMDRIYLSRVSVEMFRDHPATGIGIGAFMSTYPRYRDSRVTVSPVTDGHQMPFSIPAETGVLGLAAELLMVGLFVYLIPRARALARSGIDVSGLAATYAFLAMSLFNVFYFAEYIWVALALVGSALRSASLGLIPVTSRDDGGSA